MLTIVAGLVKRSQQEASGRVWCLLTILWVDFEGQPLLRWKLVRHLIQKEFSACQADFTTRISLFPSYYQQRADFQKLVSQTANLAESQFVEQKCSAAVEKSSEAESGAGSKIVVEAEVEAELVLQGFISCQESFSL